MPELRTVAIIAHVDHGKTTLVDALLRAGGAFQAHEVVETCVMDSNDQEKERGITIYAKNASIEYKGTKVNIVDTPGHADFGSEVERVLRTVDATILVVDAFEGPMPQTKFVLRKSLDLGLKVLVVINKIDKPTSRPDWVLGEIFDLFHKLGASDEQLDFPHLFTIARDGVAIRNLDDEKKDITPLLDWILEQVPAAEQKLDAPFRFQPAMLAYDNFVGRIGVGRVTEGSVRVGQTVSVLTPDGHRRPGKISKLFGFRGIQRVEVPEISAGDIGGIAGVADLFVGETVAANPDAEPLPAISVDPPSLAMYFMVNDSPFAGREGKFVTSRQIRERLEKELETNVGLRIEFGESAEKFKVLGRGEMHLAVLIETMRREGFELQVSQPEVILRDEAGVVEEPFENTFITVPTVIAGKIIELMSGRKGNMTNMRSEGDTTMLEFEIPARGLLGIRSSFIILTKGEGTMFSSFSRYAPHVGPIERRSVGSMISCETGEATAFSIFNAQPRGPLFISPGTKLYEGMIVGEHNQGSDIIVNVTKGKKLTNMRSSGADEALTLIPPVVMTLEKALEYIKEDELVEVTPLTVRLRKKGLTENDRKKMK